MPSTLHLRCPLDGVQAVGVDKVTLMLSRSEPDANLYFWECPGCSDLIHRRLSAAVLRAGLDPRIRRIAYDVDPAPHPDAPPLDDGDLLTFILDLHTHNIHEELHR